MKLKSLILGLCFALCTLAATAPVEARQTTAFNSFNLRLPINTTDNPYSCITESYGAVVNNCTYQVSVVFDLVTDNAPSSIVHTVKVQNYVNGTGTAGATCNVWSYDGNGNGREGTNLIFNPSGSQTLTFTTVLFGDGISLLCDLPAGEGVSHISWNP